MTTRLCILLLSISLAVQAQRVTIVCDSPRQTVRHFGASDAWSMQDIGLWEDTVLQTQVADWLFSLDTLQSGQPRGIALSTWRFNLGAGSAEQGREAQINRSTRTECVLRPDGTYDWTRQAGQRKFLRMARERGVPFFHAFLNSAPVYFTKNGLATNTGRGGDINLRDDCYDDFAEYIATALQGIAQRDGIHFDYVSPVNEPDGHWNWLGPKQEGSPATNREIARLARATAKALNARGMDTEVIVNESSDLRCLLGIYQTSWDRGNTIRTFFSADSTETCLTHQPGVAQLIAAHSYWTNTPVRYMREIREQLRDTLARYGVKYWQTEICIMANDEEIGGGGGYDFTMKTALYVARVIHHDLVFADAESWSWWRAAGGDYKDGLVKYDTHRGRQRLDKPEARDSRLMWAMGNYSRFVRPGAVRYDIEQDTDFDPYGLMCSAYRNTNGQWVVVAINYSHQEKSLTLGMRNPGSAGSKSVGCWRMYRTSDAEDETLKPVGYTTGVTVLPPRSITTLVATY